jgi:protein-S-isoprenylcysteine O-methyltransferase Ste14
MELFFFLPAGFNFAWLEAWLFLIIFFSYVIFVIGYFWNRSPELLQSRSSIKPEKGWDTIMLVFLGLAFLLMFIIPALEVNPYLNISPIIEIHVLIKIIAFFLIIIGYIIIFFVMRENSYATKSIRVQEEQQVIDTGPYAYVRHPMYSGFVIMIIGLPLSLGSLISVIPAIIAVLCIGIRAVLEEKALIVELQG